jgi:hypothetical protein
MVKLWTGKQSSIYNASYDPSSKRDGNRYFFERYGKRRALTEKQFMSEGSDSKSSTIVEVVYVGEPPKKRKKNKKKPTAKQIVAKKLKKEKKKKEKRALSQASFKTSKVQAMVGHRLDLLSYLVNCPTTDTQFYIKGTIIGNLISNRYFEITKKGCTTIQLTIDRKMVCSLDIEGV